MYQNRRHALTRALSISFITFKDFSIDSVTSSFFFFSTTNLSRERNRNININRERKRKFFFVTPISFFSMKGEIKMKSKMKWVGLIGIVLSAFSIFIHFLLARFTELGVSDYQSSVTIFSWRPIFDKPDFLTNSASYRRLWGQVKRLESLYPDSNPRGYYPDPGSQTNGFIFVRIQGDFHEIRNSIADVVVVARLLNATLAMPEIQSTTSSKGISSEFKSFADLYNEDQFIFSLAKDVKVVRTLPKYLKGARRKKEIPVFKVPYSASPFYYLHHVLQWRMLAGHSPSQFRRISKPEMPSFFSCSSVPTGSSGTFR